MIDSDLINDVWDIGSLDLHWVVLESQIIWNYTPGILGKEQMKSTLMFTLGEPIHLVIPDI